MLKHTSNAGSNYEGKFLIQIIKIRLLLHLFEDKLSLFIEMKKLKFFATVTAILGFLSVLALIFLYLDLSDIADIRITPKLEWYVTGSCLIILSAFTISTFIMLGFFVKTLRISERLTIETRLSSDVNSKSKKLTSNENAGFGTKHFQED